MRATIVVASHNEGRRLIQTIQSCVETTFGLDYEIVVADDASSDHCAEQAVQAFPQIRLVRHATRLGAAPTKALGARHARGQVLVFLDGHSKVEQGAIRRLVEDVEHLQGSAIVTPRVGTLDTGHWRTDVSAVGHGYWLKLEAFECGWLDLGQMHPAEVGGRTFFESPALIGCVLAVSRELYDKLLGFDVHMRYWGVEDLDFGLKCWLLGHRILHDPEPTIGHRFREAFDNYSVPLEHVIVNQLRMARKNFTHAVWAEWVDRARQQNTGRAAGAPEGLWARAWHLFEAERESAEQERAYLHARAAHDEFWYAQRFGLNWPRLEAGASPLRALFPLSSIGPSSRPSPSPPPSCRVTGIVPANPKVLAGIAFKFSAQGNNLGGVQWSATPAGTPATGTGPAFTTRWNSSGAKQVTARCSSTSATTTATVVAVSGVLTPRDNFSGRSNTRYGVGEIIDLSFAAIPPVTAASLGGLRWFIASGSGTLAGTASNDGQGVYTAPDTAAAKGSAVRLVLKVMSGPNTGQVAATRNITVTPPTDALMVKNSGLRHTQNFYGIGFKANIFFRPTDVSFSRMMFAEGTCAGVASGYLAALNGIVHPPTAVPVSVGTGNSTDGCQLNGQDEVNILDRPGPFSVGDFLWPIPWQYQVGTTALTQFTIANHHNTADAAGAATGAKKGAGPFTRLLGDPTSGY
jgi:glycosyltransferase involved in cell wall biosynthesis